jgi:hypothetical protein
MLTFTLLFQCVGGNSFGKRLVTVLGLLMANKDTQVILYRLAEQDRKLDAIHEQAVITNRRVAKLEKWQAFIEGGLAVLTVLVLPLLLYVIASAGLGPQAIAL